jgi:hypothetical protein
MFEGSIPLHAFLKMNTFMLGEHKLMNTFILLSFFFFGTLLPKWVVAQIPSICLPFTSLGLPRTAQN